RQKSISASTLLPASRAYVTPVATITGNALWRESLRWVCMSQRPGIRNLPRPSTTCAPFGGGVLSTDAMRSPSITTLTSATAMPLSVSMIVTCVIAMIAAANRTPVMPCALCSFEQRSGALPPAYTHRDDAVTRLAPRHLAGDRADKARAGHAERMADRNRPAVWIEPFHRDAELIAAVNHLRRERFVQLPDVDVL